jgi:hypothetical protein
VVGRVGEYAATGLWLAIAIFGVIYEARALERGVTERNYLLVHRLNGARKRFCLSLIRAAQIGLVVNVANLALGLGVIMLARSLFVSIAVPLVLLGGMIGMNLRSYLGGRTLADLANMEEPQHGSQ